MDANYLHLAERFFQRLLEHRPVSVLDVGCGRGHLVGRCWEHDIPAVGIDPSSKRLALVRDVGFRCARAAASPLPFGDGAFDWVVTRHVLHHLPDLRGAVAEACRVARRGLLVAEPWFDTRLPTQRASQRADRWLKRQDTRHGHPHRPALDPHEVLGLLPAPDRVRWEVEHYFRPWPLPVERFRQRSGRPLAELGDDHPERREHASIVADLERHGLTDCGTVIVTIQFEEE